MQDFKRDPSDEEIAEILGLPTKKISTVLRLSKKPMSVDCPFDEDDDNSLADMLQSNIPHTDYKLEQESLSKDIEELLKTLPIRTRDIIRLHFGMGCEVMSLEEIAKLYGMTRERVRQILYKTLQELSHNAKELKVYL